MGIYIKGVEMPDMRQAYIGLTICWDGEVYPFVPPAGHELGESIANAVPVPPHGRLVDADALSEHKFVCIPRVDLDGKNVGRAYRLGWNSAIEAVMENAETIIGGE